MKILFDLGHPAHVHYFKNLIKLLEKNGNQVLIIARKKTLRIIFSNTIIYLLYLAGKGQKFIWKTTVCYQGKSAVIQILELI